jgi:hypothetical protein
VSVDESKSSPPKPPIATKRRRISFASWLCASLVLLLWLLLAGPGLLCAKGDPSDLVVSYRYHGWPAVYCVTFNAVIDPSVVGTPEEQSIRDALESHKNYFNGSYSKLRFVLGWAYSNDLYPEDKFFWSDPEKWKYFGSNVQWQIQWLGFAVNLLVLFGGMFAAVCFIEYRIRRKGGLFRFSLGEMLVLFALVAFAVGKTTSFLRDSANDHLCVQKSSDLNHNKKVLGFGRSAGITVYWKNKLPMVLRRLPDQRDSIAIPWANYTITFDRVHKIKLSYVDVLKKDRPVVAQCLHQLTALESLDYYDENFDPWLLDLELYKNVKRLTFENQNNSDFDWLHNFRNLQAFQFYGPDELPLDVVLEEIPKPDKLLLLSIDSVDQVDATTDFRRFKNLCRLDLPGWRPDVFEELVQRDPRLKRLINHKPNR